MSEESNPYTDWTEAENSEDEEDDDSEDETRIVDQCGHVEYDDESDDSNGGEE
ncbi:hypothetical protein ACFQE1_05155 [Halobium palmae]|uniref:Uncharacterized protein n=1 Tax=Halobium palmae TaxID=1776492 RepID=A0ABD5RWR4_9EURY